MPGLAPTTAIPSIAPPVPPTPPSFPSPMKSSLVKTPSEVTAEIEAKYVKLPETEEFELNLASYVKACWTKAKKYKQAFENQLLANKRQIEGIYDPEKLDAIRNVGGSEAYMLLTATKTRAAKAWVEEVLFQPGAKPWGIEPTPIPDLPDEIRATMLEEILSTYLDQMLTVAQQNPDIDPANLHQELTDRLPEVEKELKAFLLEKAKETAEEMNIKIDDQLTEGGWYDALYDTIPDIILGTGIVKGPIYKKRKIHKPVSDPVTKRITITKEEKIIPCYEARPPTNIYPAPNSTSPNDGYLIDRITMTARNLQDLIGVPGFDEAEIREVLSEYKEGKLTNWLDTDIDSNLEEINSDSPGSSATLDSDGSGSNIRVYDSDKIECLELWGAIQGKMLQEWGMSTKNVPDSELFYDVVVWQINDHTIKAMLNDHVSGDKPFSKASFIDRKDCFWGQGLPETIVDSAQSCNACARAIINNVGMACLTGDTAVYRDGQDHKYSAITLNELWDKKSQHNSGLRRIKLRSLDEETGEFFGNRIVDIFDNGIGEVFEVITENGYKIKATGNHRFMRDDGEWQFLDDFDIGELIAVNGAIVPLPSTCIDCGIPTKGKGLRCKSCAATLAQSFPGQKPKICIECGAPTATRGVRCRACAFKLGNSPWNQKQIRRSRDNKDVNETTARNRYDCQSKKKDFCETCGRNINNEPDLRLENHHIDRVPWNNKDENLQTLCSSCHSKLHAREDSLGDPFLHRYVTYDCITSITHVGKERVFDLSMTAPHHNFIANGFVSHNSGPMAERNIDRIPRDEIEDNVVVPWKVWDVTDEQMSTAPAIKFYSPPLVAERILTVFTYFSNLADEQCGVPAYAHGDMNVGGAGRTASGLSMLMTGATRGIRSLIKSIDKNIIVPTVKAQYYQNIERKENYGLVCDYTIVARGSDVLMAKQQQAIRRMEFASALANPFDIKLTGEDGRRYMLREVAKSLDMDADKVFPQQQGQQQGGGNGQGMPEGIENIMNMGGGGGQDASPATLDVAGNPAQGADFREFVGAGGSAKRYV